MKIKKQLMDRIKMLKEERQYLISQYDSCPDELKNLCNQEIYRVESLISELYSVLKQISLYRFYHG